MGVNQIEFKTLYAKIDTASSGNNTIVANASVGQRIVVEDWLINAHGVQTVQWKDSLGNELTGAMDIAADGNALGQTANPRGHFSSAAAADLVLVLGSSVQSSGALAYHYEW